MNFSNEKIPKPVIIKEIKEESAYVKTFKLGSYIEGYKFENIAPGKFCNIWIPKFNMKPFSISDFENDLLSFTVKKIGKTTTYMYEKLKIGDKIGLMGPLGKGFTIQGNNVLLVGGGFGLAPLRYLLKELLKNKLNITSLLGFKTESDIFFLDIFEKYSNLHITTEDGCMGIKSKYCTDQLDYIFEEHKIDQIYCCGPELMMFKVLEFAIEHNINAQFSLERYIGCGIGICGKCVLNGKFRVCLDGPVIDSSQLKELSDFGRLKLTKNGSKIKIE